ncbi:MAG: hypothetical protein ACXADB_12655 [Candidatus Hermodarchaeia archaeon]|jgi:hypothetical protein
MSIVASRNQRGQVCASIIPGHKLTKKAKMSKHMLHSPKGWAFDTAILQEACSRGATEVEVIDTETQVTYTAPISAFWKSGIPIERGHGLQRVLPIARWEIHDPSLPVQHSFFELVD